MMKMGHLSVALLLLLPLCTLVIGTSIKNNNGLHEMIITNYRPGMQVEEGCPPQRNFVKPEHEICHHSCNMNSNCPANQKCCSDNCHKMCKPIAKEKPGTCPTFEASVMATQSSTDYCTSDAECRGTLKCCRKGRGRTCVPTLSDMGKPSVPSSARGGFCRQEELFKCMFEEQDFCDAESCIDGYKCCPKICRMECQKTIPEKAGTCPPSNQCPPEAESKVCSSDYDCQTLFKCCRSCGNRCVKAVNVPSFLHNSTSTMDFNGGK